MSEKKDDNWEQKTIEKIAMSAIAEQKRSRRWGILFKLLTLLYLGIILFSIIVSTNQKLIRGGDFTALININGLIGSNLAVTAEDVIGSLEDAYNAPGVKAIILSINSPGGSPVQAGMINDEILRYKDLYPEIPVYAVVEDICASGGYYIAVAADQMFVNKASSVGSIGVRMDGCGFEEAILKLGIERRLMIAGENKGIMDPFLPISPEQNNFIQELLSEIHEQFIAVVKQGRGNKLSSDPVIFSGLFWNGASAINLGLADHFGSVDYVVREVVGHKEVVDFTHYDSFSERFAEKIGAGIGLSIGQNFINNIKQNFTLN